MTLHSPSIQRLVLAAAACAALVLCEPPRARASGVPTFDDDTFAASLLVTSAIGFGALDLAFFAADRPLPVGLSILQIAVGGVLVPLLSLHASDTGVHVFAGVSSAWFTGHGLFNLASYGEYARKRERAVAAERARREAARCYGPDNPPCP